MQVISQAHLVIMPCRFCLPLCLTFFSLLKAASMTAPATQAHQFKQGSSLKASRSNKQQPQQAQHSTTT